MRVYTYREDEIFPNHYEEWVPIDTTYGEYEFNRFFRPENMPWYRNLRIRR